MIRGTPKFDGVAIAEGSFNFLGTGPALVGKAAFVSTKTGDTYGWTKNEVWSRATIEKLQELRALMEIDLGLRHLEGGGESLAGPATLAGPSGGLRDLGGLGDHLSGDGTRSV
jgi:hypothetical protein